MRLSEIPLSFWCAIRILDEEYSQNFTILGFNAVIYAVSRFLQDGIVLPMSYQFWIQSPPTFLVDWLPIKARVTSLLCYLTQCWGKRDGFIPFPYLVCHVSSWKISGFGGFQILEFWIKDIQCLIIIIMMMSA